MNRIAHSSLGYPRALSQVVPIFPGYAGYEKNGIGESGTFDHLAPSFM